jgi:tetratricopeptide (TPR) repeat protein
VGESTYLQAKGAFSFDKLEPVSVKGKAEPVIPYKLMEEKTEVTRGLATQGISSPLVGRSTEFAAIRTCVNRLVDGQGSILSVIGEAGLGKSRLMTEIRRHFERENLLWLEGRTLSYGQKISYWPFKEIFKAYAGITEDDGDFEAWEKFETKITGLFEQTADEILPYLASLLGLEVKGELGKKLKYLDGESMGKQVYLSSRRFFERLAFTRPLVLVFEDLHWADESSTLLIEHLFPLTNRVPLLLCGVSRPEVNAPAARLQETALRDYERRYTEIRLNPLSPTECIDLMNNLLAIENLPSRIRQLILSKADGNPFFVEEIMRTLVDRGAVRFENGRWRVTSHIETITIPDTIQGVIMARIDRLDDDVKQILRTASVIGRAFLYRLLKEVTEAVRELDRQLDTLTASELIREKQKTPELEYIFKHALVQESTYESILLKKRRELHGKVASAIEQLFSERLDEFASVLAYHYAKAEDWEKAQEYLFKAGDQAGSIAADAEALIHYQQALDAYGKVFGDRWDPLQRGILERKMGEAFYRRAEYDQAMEYLQRALTYFGRPRLAASAGKVRLSIVEETVIQICHRMFSRWLVKNIGGATDRTVEEVHRTYEIVMSIEALTVHVAFLRTALTSLNYFERKGYGPGIALNYACLGLIAFLLSFARLERFFLKRAVALSEEIGEPAALIPAHADSTLVDWHAGRLHDAIDHASRAREVCRKAGYPNLLFWALATNYAAIAHVHLGDLDTALLLGSELVHMGEDTNDPFVRVCGFWPLIEVQDRKGRFEDCITNLEKSIEVCETMQIHDGRVNSGYKLSRSYLRLGEIEKSLDALTQCDAYRIKHDAKQFVHFVFLSYFRLYLAATERANGKEREDWLKKARRARRKALYWSQLRRIILPEATRLQGVYDWLTGREASAQAHWQRSLKTAEEMGMRYEVGMTHLEMGRRLKDLEHLLQAEAIFTEIGAEWDLAETRQLLERFQR